MLTQQLHDKFQTKNGLISIVGLGYVGLPLLLRFAEVGYHVLGIDIDETKVNALNKGVSYIPHISNERISKNQSRIQGSLDFSHAAEADAIILCVPTPLTKCREPDLTFVHQTLESLLPHFREGQVLSLESTTYPGTTEEVLKPIIESKGLKIGKDFFLVYSPEREDPGNADYSTGIIPKVCAGVTDPCLAVGTALYGSIVSEVVAMSSTRAAEMTKLLENIHRAVNIGLVNEMKLVTDKMGLDIHEIIHAASTKPFGFVAYRPGPGIGGHCIPIDPFYLTWKAREYGVHTRFIELAGEVNSYMPHWVVKKITDALNAEGKAIKNSRILILGLAYKKNVSDTRESPSMVIMDLLAEKGALLDYADPHVPVFPQTREHWYDLKSVPLTEENLAAYDCAVVTTAHLAFDYDLIQKACSLVIDTRGVFSETRENIVKA